MSIIKIKIEIAKIKQEISDMIEIKNAILTLKRSFSFLQSKILISGFEIQPNPSIILEDSLKKTRCIK